MHFWGLNCTCRGVPDSAHLCLEVSAKTARAVEQRRSLMLCASSRTTLLHLTCLSISSLQSFYLSLIHSYVLQSSVVQLSVQKFCCRAAANPDAVYPIQDDPHPPHLLVRFHSLTHHSFPRPWLRRLPVKAVNGVEQRLSLTLCASFEALFLCNSLFIACLPGNIYDYIDASKQQFVASRHASILRYPLPN